MADKKNSCPICCEPLDDDKETVSLTLKGSTRINEACIERNIPSLQTKSGDKVHVKCRKDFTDKRRIEQYVRQQLHNPNSAEASKRLRSCNPKFVSKEECLYCGTVAATDRKRREQVVSKVTLKEVHHSIMAKCQERDDYWAQCVKKRIETIPDLIAADGVYHHACYRNFWTFKDIPEQYQSEDYKMRKKQRLSVGRPRDDERNECFQKVVKYFQENDEEQLTISDLVKKMKMYLEEGGSVVEAYSTKYMKQRLEEHFGDKVIITTIAGKHDVITFMAKASSILSDFHSRPQRSQKEEIASMVETVGRLIRSEIKQQKINSICYPLASDLSDQDMALNFLTESLQLLLRTIIPLKNMDLKIASIGQAVMQATRPRVMLAPLQFGLGADLHHHFGSRFLLDTLNKHGFCSSYSEVQKFERSAAVVQGRNNTSFEPHQFVQYTSDNADHDLCTIDGKGTFHGMGIIASATPASSSAQMPVPRVAVTNEDIANAAKIEIRYFNKECNGLANMNFERLSNLHVPDIGNDFNVLWKTSLLLKVPMPGWNGMMQLVRDGNHEGPASITFLPMIDLNPSDLSCIYTTLLFICKEAAKYNFTPINTFDQPLWWKALMITKTELSTNPNSILKSLVLRLGPFHMEMSFLGAIGYLMKGSGLEHILEIIYAKNTVPHILSGKAVSRAIRGHFIVDSALNALLLAKIYNLSLLPVDENDGCVGNENLPDELLQVKELLSRLQGDKDYQLDASDSETLQKIQKKVNEEKERLSQHRTAQLWIQYMEQVDILKRFIAAERTGDWMLHLSSEQEMEPYMAAAGHNLYAKSIHIDLQLMQHLAETNPHVFQCFQSGLHVIRRSNRYWAGLSSDLVIEQVLMRSMKTTGGLTHGRGMNDKQRDVWVLSMPACAAISQAMQCLSGVRFQTSEQHKEVSKARVDRDTKDANEVLVALAMRDPFGPDMSLRNIMNGVTAEEKVNVDNAKAIGDRIVCNMVGSCVENYSFKRKEQAISMGARTAVEINGELIQVDSELLFQRLIATVPTQEELQNLFKFELCSYPSSLFDSYGLPRSANKAQLADALWGITAKVNVDKPKGSPTYVLDGGALLQRIPWPKDKTYNELCKLYHLYIQERYGKNVKIVFDGYENGPSTKDVAHMRRIKTPGPVVSFESWMPCKLKKEDFLSNQTNKQKFIILLGSYLQNKGYEVHHALADADTLIVEQTLASAEYHDTVLIGDDTDLLVLLIYHVSARPLTCKVFMKPERKVMSKKMQRIWNIKSTVEALGQELCGLILVIHAWFGCDAVSRIQGFGKGTFIKKRSPELHEVAGVFVEKDSKKEDIITAGEQIMVLTYGGHIGQSIDDLRYRKFSSKTASRMTAVQVSSLPPTSSALKFHSMRVYYQVQEWIHGEEALQLDPSQWGWTLRDKEGKLFPVLTDQPPAPSKLLELVKCNCKGDCDNKRCTCKKHGLECSQMCGECRGVSCLNSPTIINEYDTD